jgi:hypothetical protein
MPGFGLRQAQLSSSKADEDVVDRQKPHDF